MPSEPMRLDEPGSTFPYVGSTADWKRRFARRILELDSDHRPDALLHMADDMALSGRWRLMGPEEAAEILFDEPTRPPPTNR
jgi:hypothetical protein